MALSVVIIDHEPLMAAQLKKCLLAVDPDITVVAICYEGEQAAACLHEYKPDLVFLTIEMPRIGGLAIAKAIQGMEGDRPDIVFVTGQRDFVSHTLRLTALDYLVKPVTEGEVAQAVRKFRALHIKKNLLREKILWWIRRLMTGRFLFRRGGFPSMRERR